MVQSEQHRAQYAQHCRDDNGFQEEPSSIQKWSPNIDTIVKKAQQRTFNLPQEIFSNPACSLLIHHCMVQISHQTGQEQTTMNSEVGRKNSLVPTSHQFRICINTETSRQHQCKTHHTLFQVLPSGSHCRALYSTASRYLYSVFPQVVTPMDTNGKWPAFV